MSIKEVTKIEEAKLNNRLVCTGLVTMLERKETKTNEPFWWVGIADGTGTIYFAIWASSNLFKYFEKVLEGETLKVSGIVDEEGRYKRMQINTVTKVDVPKDELVDNIGIRGELGLQIRNIQDVHLKELLFNIFKRADVLEHYFKAPLTMFNGGSFEGGLSAAVLRLCRLIDASVSVFEDWEHNTDGVQTILHRDFMKAVAMIEPIGKIHTLTIKNKRVVKTMEGELLSDSLATMEILLEELAKSEMSPENKLLLKHTVASAQGRSDWGSLVQERTKEAVAFHLLWNLNLQMLHFEQLKRTVGDADFGKIVHKRVYLNGFENSVIEEVQEEKLKENEILNVDDPAKEGIEIGETAETASPESNLSTENDENQSDLIRELAKTYG